MQLAKWAALALTLAPVAVGAEQREVEALIDRCWAASQQDLSSDSTLRIGRGVSAVIDCLEREIIRRVEASLECVPGCGKAYNNVAAFELAERLEDVLRAVATERHEDFAGTGLTTQEFIAAGRAQANEETTVSIRLNRDLSSTASSAIGELVMPCNPMWAEGCEIPGEPLARMLRDAGGAVAGRRPPLRSGDCGHPRGVLTRFRGFAEPERSAALPDPATHLSLCGRAAAGLGRDRAGAPRAGSHRATATPLPIAAPPGAQRRDDQPEESELADQIMAREMVVEH